MDDKLLGQLIDNAFDFLEVAIDQFETAPKYSVIHFCAAVELFLKARLMHEHWSLVVATKNHPDINKFKSGDFQSINLNDLIPKISSVTGEKIPTDASDCFKKLAKHRNKMIHFFHEAHGEERNEEELEKIAIEQCGAWFFLRRLLEKWGEVFGEYEERTSSINVRMKAHNIYLDAVYERIKPEIKAAKAKGIIFVPCGRCRKETSEEFERTKHIFEYKCRVCLSSNDLIKLPCAQENCDGEIKIDPFWPDDISCGKCKIEIDHQEVSNLLETNASRYEDSVQTNCAACCGLGTVVENDDGYFICTDCFYFTQNDIGHCNFCQENQIGGGDLEHSRWSGCEFCDGQAGHMKDD